MSSGSEGLGKTSLDTGLNEAPQISENLEGGVMEQGVKIAPENVEGDADEVRAGIDESSGVEQTAVLLKTAQENTSPTMKSPETKVNDSKTAHGLASSIADLRAQALAEAA